MQDWGIIVVVLIVLLAIVWLIGIWLSDDDNGVEF